MGIRWTIFLGSQGAPQEPSWFSWESQPPRKTDHIPWSSEDPFPIFPNPLRLFFTLRNHPRIVDTLSLSLDDDVVDDDDGDGGDDVDDDGGDGDGDGDGVVVVDDDDDMVTWWHGDDDDVDDDVVVVDDDDDIVSLQCPESSKHISWSALCLEREKQCVYLIDTIGTHTHQYVYIYVCMYVM